MSPLSDNTYIKNFAYKHDIVAQQNNYGTLSHMNQKWIDDESIKEYYFLE